MRISAISPSYSYRANSAYRHDTAQKPLHIDAMNKPVSFGALDRASLDYSAWEQTYDIPIPRKYPPRALVKTRIPAAEVIPQEVVDLNLNKVLKLDVPEINFMDIRQVMVTIRRMNELITNEDGRKEVATDFFKRRTRECLTLAHEIKAKVLTKANCDLNIFGAPGERILYGHTPDYKFCFVKELDRKSGEKITIYKNDIPTVGNRILVIETKDNREEHISMWDFGRNKVSIVNDDFISINDRLELKVKK